MTARGGSGRRRHNRGETCPDCGHLHTKCLAHSKHNNPDRRAKAIDRWGNGPDGPWPCMMQPVPGAEVCKHHGGRSPGAIAAATDKLTRERALGEVGDLLNEADALVAGRPVEDAVQDSLDRASAMVTVLGLLVAELHVDTTWHWENIPGAAGGISRYVALDTPAGLIGPNARGEQRSNVLVDLYGEWTDRLARISKAAADLGLAERRIAIDEAQAQAVVGAVLAGLRDANADTPTVRAAIAERLRAIEADTP